MILQKVTSYKYKSFLTEQSIEIEPEVTCIVGKGALLEAIAKTQYYDDTNAAFKSDKDLD